MALYNIKESDAKLHISKGNNKIGKGIWSFSTLPGNDKHLLYIKGKDGAKEEVRLTDIAGTCSKYCEGCARDGACYAWRDAKLHHNVTIRAWGENTLLLRSGRVWPLLQEFLDTKNEKATQILEEWRTKHGGENDPIDPRLTIKEIIELTDTWSQALEEAKKVATIKMFRINVSGEIENVEQLLNWAALAKSHPEINFGIYTKNYDALADYFDHYTKLPPDAAEDPPVNLIINVSEWHGVAADFIEKYKDLYPDAFNIFEYDDTNKKDCDLSSEDRTRLAATVHCPAVNFHGHHATDKDGNPITCDRCKKCYTKTGKRTAVWAH